LLELLNDVGRGKAGEAVEHDVGSSKANPTAISFDRFSRLS